MYIDPIIAAISSFWGGADAMHFVAGIMIIAAIFRALVSPFLPQKPKL